MSLPDPETTEAEAVTVDDADVFGDLPDDNPFREVAERMREDGEDWEAIYNDLAPVYNAIDHAAFESSKVIIPEFEIKVVVPDAEATSGERYETITHAEATEEKAVEWAEDRPEVRRVEHVERTGEVTVA